MIQVSHMATAAKQSVQENTVWQVPEDFLIEMKRVESERIKLGIFGRSKSQLFRKLRASKELLEWLGKQKLMRVPWPRMIGWNEESLKIKRMAVLREKVMSWREKEFKERQWNSNCLVDLNRGVYWKASCGICRYSGHRTYDCYFTFDRVLKRMEAKENETKKERLGNFNPKIEIVYNREKRKKVMVLEKEELLGKFKDVFYEENEVIKFCEIEKCRIKTPRNQKVVKRGVMVPQALKGALTEHLKNLERRCVIRRSNSEWRNPIRALQKPNGGIRLVSNFIALNDLCEKDPYKLKNIREVINETQGFKFFTVLDLKDAFYSIEIEECDKHKTAFEFNGVVYEWNGMVMGFKNAPQILQRVMSKILEEEILKGVSIYMDDIIVAGKTRHEHDKLLTSVLQKIKRNNMKVNKAKMQLALGEVKVLGVIINGLEQTPNEIKQNEAMQYPKPSNLKEMRRFLGLAGWFRSFIPQFASKTLQMTESLKKSTNEWKWNERMQNEFDNLRKDIKDMKKIILPDYEKMFVLKTDASNVGLGAVLMQDVHGELVPVQWASKKLTETERRYGISEKEMLAVFWGIKKFDYDLRGRKFKLITDHKALENIREKPYFENNRINRWIEKIQEYDFSIEYQKPDNLVGPDALSRLHENMETKQKCKKHGEKLLQAKINKHVLKENGKEYWISDNGKKREMPEVEQRKQLVIAAHKESNHRGVEAVYYKIKQNMYWVGMKKTIENVIHQCELCNQINRKKKCGYEFVTTDRALQKVALDLIEYRIENCWILISIDYYTRFVMAKVIKSKSSTAILSVLKDWTSQNAPEEIITDNGKEFCNENFEKMCTDKKILHTKVAVESHNSNGRIERVIRTVREGLLKAEGKILQEKLEFTVGKYNETYHEAIKMTPKEAASMNNEELYLANSKFGKNATKYKLKRIEKFAVNQKILYAQRENIKSSLRKDYVGRFMEKGKIVGVLKNNSYLVQKENDSKIVKKRYFDLKGVCGTNYGETTV